MNKIHDDLLSFIEYSDGDNAIQLYFDCDQWYDSDLQMLSSELVMNNSETLHYEH